MRRLRQIQLHRKRPQEGGEIVPALDVDSVTITGLKEVTIVFSDAVDITGADWTKFKIDAGTGQTWTPAHPSGDTVVLTNGGADSFDDASTYDFLSGHGITSLVADPQATYSGSVVPGTFATVTEVRIIDTQHAKWTFSGPVDFGSVDAEKFDLNTGGAAESISSSGADYAVVYYNDDISAVTSYDLQSGHGADGAVATASGSTVMEVHAQVAADHSNGHWRWEDVSNSVIDVTLTDTNIPELVSGNAPVSCSQFDSTIIEAIYDHSISVIDPWEITVSPTNLTLPAGKVFKLPDSGLVS